MYYRLKEIFAIGIGPSSSHTVGPMKAAKRFVDNLIAQNLLEKAEKLTVDLYGSLALTGIGHGTLRAIVYGLMGFVAEDVDTEKPYYNSLERDKILHLAQQKPISFDVAEDMHMNKETFLPEHSNGMTFCAFAADGKELLRETYFSIGGGTIVRQDEFALEISPITPDVPYQFNSCADLQRICKETGLTFSDIVLKNEFSLSSESQVYAYLQKIRDMMLQAVDRGMRHSGTLPGGLEVKRRAPEIYQHLK
ncbi:MAG: L-serine ammonia-lyase, partial [Alphaproteobacteria bacterium]|nr:L-serine ammonia-lyase [Alphaproteobacteria bacterium]